MWSEDTMIQLEKEVLLFLTEWSYHIQRVRKLEEMFATAKVNMTVEYRESASSGRSGSSMVEELVMKKARIEGELQTLVTKMKQYIQAVNKCGLTQVERDIIVKVTKSESLLRYACDHDIYPSYVYKIRNRAVKKIVNYLLETSFCDKTRVKV